jgi:Outer membrane protein beta-barrel domain
MKKSTLTFTIICAACAVGALSYAGTEKYAGKEIMQQAPAPCEWYRAHEWDLDVWGTIAFPVNTGHFNDFRTGDFDSKPDLAEKEHIDIGAWSQDRLINRDNAWGGGADIKYFFSKYWGLGVEGFVLDANDNIAGAGLMTFTLRYPIGCSRFAPYAWAGVGALGGGSHTVRFFNEQQNLGQGTENEIEFRANQTLENKKALCIGQFGGGLEIRITRHIGVMGDVSYAAVQETNNDFWMARFGVTLSY